MSDLYVNSERMSRLATTVRGASDYVTFPQLPGAAMAAADLQRRLRECAGAWEQEVRLWREATGDMADRIEQARAGFQQAELVANQAVLRLG